MKKEAERRTAQNVPAEGTGSFAERAANRGQARLRAACLCHVIARHAKVQGNHFPNCRLVLYYQYSAHAVHHPFRISKRQRPGAQGKRLAGRAIGVKISHHFLPALQAE